MLIDLASRKQYISLYVTAVVDDRYRRVVRRAAAEGVDREELQARPPGVLS